MRHIANLFKKDGWSSGGDRERGMVNVKGCMSRRSGLGLSLGLSLGLELRLGQVRAGNRVGVRIGVRVG